jgi:hypothetical protein
VLLTAHFAADHALAQQVDGNVELLLLSKFVVVGIKSKLFADDVQVRMRSSVDQMLGCGLRIADFQMIADRRPLIAFRIEQDARNLHRGCELPHSARPGEDPAVLKTLGAQCTCKHLQRTALTEDLRHAPAMIPL